MTNRHTNDSRKKGRFTKGELDTEIFKLLTKLGISANLKGFRYLNSAISTVYYDPQAGVRVVNGLYPRLAIENHTTPECIERSMRTALLRVRRADNEKDLYSIFGISAGLTPKKFINSAAKKLREDGGVDGADKKRNAK